MMLRVIAVLAVVLVSRFGGAASQGLRWMPIQIVGDGPLARQGHSLVFDDLANQLVLFGGANSSGDQLNDVWLFSIDNGTWTQPAVSSPTPPGRRYAYSGLVRVSGQSLLVITHGFGEVEYSDVWTFNLDTQEWTELQLEGGPGARYGGHFGSAFGATDAVWVGGGFTATTTLQTRYIDTYKLIFSGNQASWEQVHAQPTVGNQFRPLLPHGRCLHGSAVVREEELAMWGGCMRTGTGGGPCPAEDGWFFNNSVGVQQWTELPRCATPRVWSAMAPLSNDPGKAVLYGGSDVFGGQVISDVAWPENEVLVADVDALTWTRYATNATDNTFPARRYAHAMAPARDGNVYMFGGRLLLDDSVVGELWMLSGDPAQTEMLDCDRLWFSYLHLHGLLNAIAYGILLPTGFLIARHYRCSGSKAWFIAHVTIQLLGVLFSIPAFVIIFFAGASKQPTHPHAIIGIFLQFFMLLQPINGILRPHIKKGEKKSLYRKIWEWVHRCWGVFVIILGLLQVSLGVFLIVPPQALWVVWVLMLLAWVVTFVVHEIIKCVRTYCLKSNGYEDEEIEMKKHP